MSLDLGYKYQMSDYASSYQAEEEYEKEGLAEVEKVVDQLVSLMSEREEAMVAIYNTIHCKNCQKKAKKILDELATIKK